jgi:TRAP-type C4-dicarboxylate transport system substrate-binding protein
MLLAADDTVAKIMKSPVVKDLAAALESSMNLQAATATDFRQISSRVAVGSTVECVIARSHESPLWLMARRASPRNWSVIDP